MIRRPFCLAAFLTVLSLGAFGLNASVSASDSKASWGYSGAEAFQHWGDLNDDYHACKDGKTQSPINIAEYEAADLPVIKAAYQVGDMQVVNNGHTIQVNVPSGSQVSVGDKTYDLLQFQFHTPSEHYIDGSPYPMEVQFVHKAADGTLGVLAVMMELGVENASIGTIWGAVPTESNHGEGNSISLSAASLLPSDLSYYKLEGSLTTPPCSEGVQWHVVKDAIEISEGQLVAFQSLFPVNARPVQPLNGRVIHGK